MLKILIDRNIVLNAVTHRTILVSKKLNWGDITIETNVMERKAFPPRENEEFRREQIPYLASLCIEAKNKKIEFYTYTELLVESIRQRKKCEGYLGIDLFRDISFKRIKSPIERTIIFSSEGSIGVSEEDQMNFFRSVKNERFLFLKKTLGVSHIDDIFHFWSGEEAKLNIFLTMDKRFYNSYNHNIKKINSDTKIMTPKTLAKKLNLAPTNTENLAESINKFA